MGRYVFPAPHDCPAELLKVRGDVALAAVSAAPLGPRSIRGHKLTPLPSATVKDHVYGLFLKEMLAIRVLSRLLARDDDEHPVNR